MPPDEPIRSEVEAFLDHAEMALDNGDPEAALESCQEALSREPKHPEALFLLAESHRDMGNLDQAVDGYRRAVLADPRYSEAWSALGIVYLVQMQWEEARRALNRAIREYIGNAEAWYGRAILRERRGDMAGADRDLARACRIDSLSFPFPSPLGDDEVERVVEEAISGLHPTLKSYLSNVAILLEEVPSDELLEQYSPPVPPGELLGYFNGYSLTERSVENPWSNLPSAIVLFRRNLQRHATDRETLIEELQTTLYHEVGHFLGLNEDDLKERGLE